MVRLLSVLFFFSITAVYLNAGGSGRDKAFFKQLSELFPALFKKFDEQTYQQSETIFSVTTQPNSFAHTSPILNIFLVNTCVNPNNLYGLAPDVPFFNVCPFTLQRQSGTTEGNISISGNLLQADWTVLLSNAAQAWKNGKQPVLQITQGGHPTIVVAEAGDEKVGAAMPMAASPSMPPAPMTSPLPLVSARPTAAAPMPIARMAGSPPPPMAVVPTMPMVAPPTAMMRPGTIPLPMSPQPAISPPSMPAPSGVTSRDESKLMGPQRAAVMAAPTDIGTSLFDAPQDVRPPHEVSPVIPLEAKDVTPEASKSFVQIYASVIAKEKTAPIKSGQGRSRYLYRQLARSFPNYFKTYEEIQGQTTFGTEIAPGLSQEQFALAATQSSPKTMVKPKPASFELEIIKRTGCSVPSKPNTETKNGCAFIFRDKGNGEHINGKIIITAGLLKKPLPSGNPIKISSQDNSVVVEEE